MQTKLSLVVLLAVALAAGLAGTAAAQGSGQPMTFVGYYMDTACAAAGKGLDGSDVLNSPQDHTKMCLVACKAGGFGLSARSGEAYVFYPFDKAGSDLSVREVLNKSQRENDFLISVDGILKDGVLTIRGIKEANLF
jgi:hypothetical protein